MPSRWAVSVLTVVPIPPVIRAGWRGDAGRADRSAASTLVRRPVVLGLGWAALAATPRRRMLVVLGAGWSSAGCPAPLVAASITPVVHARSGDPWACPPNMAFQRSGEIGPILAAASGKTVRAIQTQRHRRPLNAQPLGGTRADRGSAPARDSWLLARQCRRCQPINRIERGTSARGAGRALEKRPPQPRAYERPSC